MISSYIIEIGDNFFRECVIENRSELLNFDEEKKSDDRLNDSNFENITVGRK